MHVAVTEPPVQPVVRPTLVIGDPTTGAGASPVIVTRADEEDIAVVQGPGEQNADGWAMTPCAPFWLPMSMTANAESLLRQKKPDGQPDPAVHNGSALSCAT